MRLVGIFLVITGLVVVVRAGGTNLVLNGNFDEGAKEASHWEVPDGLTSFWRMDKERGRILELDTRPLRKQVQEYWEERKQNPSAVPPEAIIPKDKLKSVGAYEGATLDSELLEVKPGQDYKLSVDFRGTNGAFVWIKGFMIHPKRGTLTDCYQTRIIPEGANPDVWQTFSIAFRPTPQTTKMKVRIYAYWPADVYYFDNVRLEEIGPTEAAELRKKRSETKGKP